MSNAWESELGPRKHALCVAGGRRAFSVLARRARGPGGRPSRTLGAGDRNASGPRRTCGHAPIALLRAAIGATGLRKRRRYQRICQNEDYQLEISHGRSSVFANSTWQILRGEKTARQLGFENAAPASRCSRRHLQASVAFSHRLMATTMANFGFSVLLSLAVKSAVPTRLTAAPMSPMRAQ
jgi:hypothetical protein